MGYFEARNQMLAALVFAFAAWLVGTISLSEISLKSRPFWLKLSIILVSVSVGLYISGDSLEKLFRVWKWKTRWLAASVVAPKAIPANFVRYEAPLMFFIPRANRSSDPYFETLFGYFPNRLGEEEFYTKTLALPTGKWAFGFLLRISQDRPITFQRRPTVRTDNENVAEIGARIARGYNLERLDSEPETFPVVMALKEDWFEFYEIEAKSPGKCQVNFLLDTAEYGREVLKLDLIVTR